MTVPSLNVSVNGLSQISADELNTFGQVCDNMAQLRTFIGITGMKVIVGGFYANNDGGQGIFFWNASGTGPDDNGVTNVVPAGSLLGCWTRLGSGAAPTTVNSVSNLDGTLIISPNSGAVVASLNLANSNVWTATQTIPLGGNSTATTQSPNNNSTKVATTAYVDSSGFIKVINKQFFSTPGSATYTPSPGMVYCITEQIAGGGGGGSTNASSGATSGGGGAGEYGKNWFPASSIGSSQPITIGAGGAGGTNGGGGSAGGNTVFGGTITVGGSGGSAVGSTDSEGGNGGGGGNSMLSIPGAPGGLGFCITGSGFSGAGASSIWGAGGKSRGSGANTGYPASGYGAGGGGTVVAIGGTGGAGSPGLIVVTEFCTQ